MRGDRIDPYYAIAMELVRGQSLATLISFGRLPADRAATKRVARLAPIGLGARDSLRTEAGLPLYGHDLDETVSPIEAGLNFAVSKRRREAADFPGAERILREFAGDLDRIRVGLFVEGAPAREGAEILDPSGAVVGVVTSGGFSPSLSRAIALGFAVGWNIANVGAVAFESLTLEHEGWERSNTAGLRERIRSLLEPAFHPDLLQIGRGSPIYSAVNQRLNPDRHY